MGYKTKFISLVVSFLCVAIILGGCGSLSKESASSTQYPTKPINVIVPFAAGGNIDLLARSLEKSSLKYLGQQMVVVNVPGGGSTIGMNEIAGANPDGYTIGVIASGAILQSLYGETRYQYATALDPMARVISSPMVVAVLADKPWVNLNDLVNYAKEHPGGIKFGHSGLGAGDHIVGEALGKEAGIKIVQVPSKGTSESLAALLGGHVQVIIGNPGSFYEYVKNGKVRILGVATEKRLNIPGLENVPTFKEQGINVAFNFCNGIVAPKGIPAAEKAKLTAGLKEIINDPEFKKSMLDMGMDVQYLGPEEFSDQWVKETSKLTRIVKETGIVDVIKAQKK